MIVQGGKAEDRIRPMRLGDLGCLVRLKQQARWNQTLTDWRRFLAISSGSFVAVRQGQVVGSVTSCRFGNTGWIGMMLVDLAHRRQGIATRLMETVLRHLDRIGCQQVRLDATPLGVPVYRRLGFRDEYEVVRLGGFVEAGCGLSDRVPRARRFRWSDWPRLQRLDEDAMGADRTKLLKRLILEDPHSARVVHYDGHCLGYALQRAGSTAQFLGPIVARNETAGETLMLDAFRRARRVEVKLDIPEFNRRAMQLAESLGMSKQRHFIRMVRGGEGATTRPVLMWASSGPEKG